MSSEPLPASQRKIQRGDPVPGCPAQVGTDGVWRVQDYAAARTVLRSIDTVQAGFGAENASDLKDKQGVPVLYRDGAEHRERRRQLAKYFTPARVDKAYRSMIERVADEQCEKLRSHGEADLTRLSLTLSLTVAAEVVGLTESESGLGRRLDEEVLGSVGKGPFYRQDVQPAIVARRRQRRDDLISHLLDAGCTDEEILGECITFLAAGILTTREFITVAAWHLFTDDDLREAYTTGEDEQRERILYEILRLEPPLGTLARWTTADLTLPGVVIPAGARVDVSVSAANLDPASFGADAQQICPARPPADGVRGPGLAFGEGVHRCPGAYIALRESDIFLRKVLAVPGVRMISPPGVHVLSGIAQYRLTDLRLSIR
ncbi:cytochrome P450 [Amycolatopsis japonica]|uniref:cytochrome P450 n=1 Tax=Amycolatopsis japonica TaxID=208439 RepID=UPI00366B4998